MAVYRNGKSHIDGRTEGHGGHGVENVDVKLGESFSLRLEGNISGYWWFAREESEC